MVLVDAEGYVVPGGNQAMINEAGFMIHSEVHKARPDVVAVAHAHSIGGKAWASFGKPIEMLTQGRAFLHEFLFAIDSWLTHYRCLQPLRYSWCIC